MKDKKEIIPPETAEPVVETVLAVEEKTPEQQVAPDEKPKAKGPMGFCPKCGKEMELLDATEAKVAGKKALKGKCSAGHDMTQFVTETKESRAIWFAESIGTTGAVLDDTAKEVELTLIAPGWSANGRIYEKSVLEAAVNLFNGVKAYADHPVRSGESDRPERSIRDIVGYYPSVWLGEDGAIKGRLRVVGEAVGWLWPLIQETVSKGVSLVNVSINALGRVEPGEVLGRKGFIVKDIIKANSVDVVTQAAAGGKFERLLAGTDGFTDDLLAALSYDEWLNVRSDYALKLREEMKTARKDEADAALATELEESKAKLASLADEWQAKLTESQSTSATIQGALDTAKAFEATLKSEYEKNLHEAVEAKSKDILALADKVKLLESERLADRLIWQAKLPDALVEGVRKDITGKSEADAQAIIETMRAGWRQTVLGEGKVPAQTVTATEPIQESQNLVAGLLGVSVVPLAGETAEVYVERKRKLLKAA